MKKVYLLAYSDSLGDREMVKNCLSEIPAVIHWRTDMANSFYITSNYSANDISKSIRSYMGSGRFIVTEITSNTQGWLHKETWGLINKKSK